MKNFILLITIITLLGIIAAGCGTADTSTPVSSTPSASSSTTASTMSAGATSTISTKTPEASWKSGGSFVYDFTADDPAQSDKSQWEVIAGDFKIVPFQSVTSDIGKPNATTTKYNYISKLIGHKEISVAHLGEYGNFDLRIRLQDWWSGQQGFYIRGTPQPLDRINRWGTFYRFALELSEMSGWFSVTKRAAPDQKVVVLKERTGFGMDDNTLDLRSSTHRDFRILAKGPKLQFYYYHDDKPVWGTDPEWFLLWEGEDSDLTHGRIGIFNYTDNENSQSGLGFVHGELTPQ